MSVGLRWLACGMWGRVPSTLTQVPPGRRGSEHSWTCMRVCELSSSKIRRPTWAIVGRLLVPGSTIFPVWEGRALGKCDTMTA